MSAASWIKDERNNFALQLAKNGYDVWIASNRGTRYSSVNDQDGEWSKKDRWDFSFAEMGMYDQPANIEKIKEVTGADKLTYIGFDHGTSQMFYGLGTNFEYFNEHLRDVIMLAPCVYDDRMSDYDELADVYLSLYERRKYYTRGSFDREATPYKSMLSLYQNYVEDQF